MFFKKAAPMLVVIMLLSLVGSGTVQAVPTLDQYFDPGEWTDLSSGAGGSTPKAQTFTVGLQGILSRIDVCISTYMAGQMNFDVRTTTGSGAPNEDNLNKLFSMNIPTSSMPTVAGWFSMDVSSYGVHVEPGDVLAMSFSGNGGISWLGSTQNVYAPGGHYYRNHDYGISNWSSLGSYDVHFRTYVDTVPVPEPATMLLLSSGLIGLAGYGRKKLFKT